MQTADTSVPLFPQGNPLLPVLQPLTETGAEGWALQWQPKHCLVSKAVPVNMAQK